MSRQFISSGSIFEQEIAYKRAVVDGDWVFVSGTTGFKTCRLRGKGEWERGKKKPLTFTL
ncbi:hypothetical protein [Nostoc sp. FACHB-133]|uniref:hypothetical protein n=1 Tax=Nostoc sp. FACHB-133 TaxID=2692835 RepID=UPI0018EF921B|nr:hypothetical protein [Nostoc sp. FACHB-133]